jgi:hypothetical protein
VKRRRATARRDSWKDLRAKANDMMRTQREGSIEQQTGGLQGTDQQSPAGEAHPRMQRGGRIEDEPMRGSVRRGRRRPHEEDEDEPMRGILRSGDGENDGRDRMRGAGIRAGLKPSWETNQSGNERQGERFRRVQEGGQEVHVYEDGRRVVDKSPSARSFQPVDMRDAPAPRPAGSEAAARRLRRKGDGTGNDVPLIGQAAPVYTGNLRNPVSVASPYARSLIEHVQERIARNRQRSRGR